MAEPIRMADLRRHAAPHLQRRNGHQQECRARCARLADHVWLQHVFVSCLEMGRRNFIRAHTSLDGFARWISDHHSRCLALAQLTSTMGAHPGRNRLGRCDLAGNSWRPSRHDDER